MDSYGVLRCAKYVQLEETLNRPGCVDGIAACLRTGQENHQHIAEAMASSKGPRIIELQGKEKKFIAVYLNADELKSLFAKEGYITEGDRHLKQIRRWNDRGDTILWMDYVIFPMTTIGQRLMAEQLAKEYDGNVDFLGM